VFVTAGANPAILRNLPRQWRAINSLVQVAKLGRLRLPDLAVTGSLPAERVGYFVQQHLLNNRHVPGFNQVPRDSDSLLRIVTKAGSPDCSIEAKGVVDQSVALKQFLG
jgi:hypothetical protein